MKKVKFIAMGSTEEVYGQLLDDQGKPLTTSGWWRTGDINQASRSAILIAGLNINDCALEIVDFRR